MSAGLVRAAESLRLRAADAADALRGRGDRFTPPRRLAGYVGDSDFRTTGEEFLGHFQTLAGLRAEDRVLEIGCGIGRMARVLVDVLRPPGSYDGFDIVAAGITWCQAHYRETPAPFRFQHADLRNSSYNPGATASASDYRFPFGDGSFDLVLATSLFTHLLTDAADHYLAETARVLARGGRLFATWYLLSDADAGSPPSPFTRRDPGSPMAVSDPEVPEAAVAFDEAWLRARLAAHGLALQTLVRGNWNGGAGTSRQDLLVASVD
jgi:SAM-dependent methyltransferase